MSWFNEVFGQEEPDYKQIGKQFSYDYEKNELYSKANKQTFKVGVFECLSNKELKNKINLLKNSQELQQQQSFQDTQQQQQHLQQNFQQLQQQQVQMQENKQGEQQQNQKQTFESQQNQKVQITQQLVEPQKIKNNKQNNKEEQNDENNLKWYHIVGNVKTFLQDPKFQGSVFQAASQFNCLEMVGPGVKPEQGIEGYIRDQTQGPACALSCPAGTLFRNYFVNQTGQCGGNQLDCLKKIGNILDNNKNRYWDMINGYCIPVKGKMAQLTKRLQEDQELKKQCFENLEVGIHWDTEVYLRKSDKKHSVCQVYTSACPVAYAKSTTSSDWTEFASLILDSAFDSVLAASYILALQRQKRVKVFLTAIGGGVFGNRSQWIIDAIGKALNNYKNAPLDVYLVHYGNIVNQYLEIQYKTSNLLENKKQNNKQSNQQQNSQQNNNLSNNNDQEEEEEEKKK